MKRVIPADVFEDIDWLLASGLSAHDVLAQLGRSASSVSKLAYRYGRTDIARPFGAIQGREARSKKAALVKRPEQPERPDGWWLKQDMDEPPY